MPVRGGPIIPRAPSTPGIVWQVLQPYLRIRSGPRSGSPPVMRAASALTCCPHPCRRAAVNSSAAADHCLRTRLRSDTVSSFSHFFEPDPPDPLRLSHFGPPFRLAQPGSEESETQGHEERSGRNPHDQSRELLIFERAEPPGARPLRIEGIPQTRREREEGSQDTAVERGGEHVEDGHAIAHPPIAAMD